MTTWNALEAIRRAQESTPGADLRTSPRFSCPEDITCGAGRVLDVSRTGIRVWTKKRPPKGDKPIGLRVDSPTGRAQVGAELVWSAKCQQKGYVLGLRLTGEDAGSASDLFKMAWDPSMGSFIRPGR